MTDLITPDAFFSKYNGVGLNFDGAYGNQCVDLAQFYNKEVVGAPPLITNITGGAIDIWTTYPQNFYTKIVNDINDPNSFPLKGDLILFRIGVYGHISVCRNADFWSVTSFDENWPVQGYYDKDGNFIGTGAAHFQGHNYLNDKIVGWLRPKTVVDPDLVKYNSVVAEVNSNDGYKTKLSKIKIIVNA